MCYGALGMGSHSAGGTHEKAKLCKLWLSLDAAAFLLPFLLLLAAQTGDGVAEEVVGFLLINLSHPRQFGHGKAGKDMSSASQLSRLEG